MHILAVDPGKATGWAIYREGRAYFGEHSFEDFPGFAWEYLNGNDPLLVIAERFVIMAGTLQKARTETNWSIELIGVLRFISDMCGHDFELQGAGDAKRLGNDGLLRKLDWWTVGSDHARDAARHVALALARHAPEELDRLLLSSES